MSEKTTALSSRELELVCDKEWILTKHIIIEKVYRLFGMLAMVMQQKVMQNATSLPAETGECNPKISRGENYRGLPYVMLDYPRHFSKNSTLAIRTLFWWGNFFSINLHLSGECKEKAMPALVLHFAALQREGYWVCVHTDPWQHHFEEDNYVPLEKYTATGFAAILQREPFIKLAKRISLRDWDLAAEFLEHHFNEIITILQINFQGDERDPSPGIPKAGFDL